MKLTLNGTQDAEPDSKRTWGREFHTKITHRLRVYKRRPYPLNLISANYFCKINEDFRRINSSLRLCAIQVTRHFIKHSARTVDSRMLYCLKTKEAK